VPQRVGRRLRVLDVAVVVVAVVVVAVVVVAVVVVAVVVVAVVDVPVVCASAGRAIGVGEFRDRCGLRGRAGRQGNGSRRWGRRRAPLRKIIRTWLSSDGRPGALMP
jgi:hypothetical protein